MRMSDVASVNEATGSGLICGADGRLRVPWAYQDPLLLVYYDEEWGRPVYDDTGVFERLSLEGFQAGLSWLTVLRKRDAFRSAFAGFDPHTVADFSSDDVECLLSDPAIIRNRRKIEATIGNARATVQLEAEGGLAELVWSYVPDVPLIPRTIADVPSVTEESAALAKDLKRRGFSFVGPTTCCAMMQAIGVIDGRIEGEWLRGVATSHGNGGGIGRAAAVVRDDEASRCAF